MSWNYATLCLPDAAAWARLRDLLPEGSDVVEVGTVLAPAVPDAAEGAQPASLDGWWVSVAARDTLPEALLRYRVSPPPGVPVLGADTLPSDRVISAAAFTALFTPSETLALMGIAELVQAALLVAAQGHVNLDSPRMAGLMAIAVARGALTRARADAVIAGRAP